MGYMGLVVGCFGGFVIVNWVLRNVNRWYYEMKLGDRRHDLPPGDLGWPFVGNMLSFVGAFKSNYPEAFISSFVTRYGKTGVQKAQMFGTPSIIVTTAEASRKVLTDDEAFKPGWPTATVELMGRRSFVGIYDEEHKWLRRLTAAPVNGHEALSVHRIY